MNGGKQPRGYTIVEVLIFMAVSGLMFVLAAVFISGKQANVEFRQSLTDINMQINTVINEVSNGEYTPLASNVGCHSASGGGYPIFSLGIPSSQGTNGGSAGCIFIGKVMQFNVGGAPTDYSIYTMAARQLDTTGNAVNSFIKATPVPVGTPPADLTVATTTKNRLQISHAFLCTNASCTVNRTIGAFGIFGSFNSALGVATGSQQSGSQSVTVAAIPGTVYGASAASTLVSLKNNTHNIAAADTLGNGKYILLCFTAGDKVGSLTVGGSNGQQFTTEVKTNGVYVLGAGHVC